MTDLKTLKDFEYELDEDELIVKQDVIYIKELRAEAIKWVKEDIRCMKELDDSSDLFKYADARIGWIQEFFNLTEDDLK